MRRVPAPRVPVAPHQATCPRARLALLVARRVPVVHDPAPAAVPVLRPVADAPAAVAAVTTAVAVVVVAESVPHPQAAAAAVTVAVPAAEAVDAPASAVVLPAHSGVRAVHRAVAASRS
ncbi:MAG: hypothetical protein QOG47_1794, partial [Mycobacterium sp.]|nr:hypothetical protein [Mycobacterium sp.]